MGRRYRSPDPTPADLPRLRRGSRLYDRPVMRRKETAWGDREIQARSLLAEGPGREVTTTRRSGHSSPALSSAGLIPVAGVLDPRAGQPGDRERREPATDVRLDGERGDRGRRRR
jgi:hypothetical protein